MSSETQKKRLMEYLDKGYPVTRLNAAVELGIFELSARIGELEKLDYPIVKRWVTVKNRFGERVRVMQYKKPLQAIVDDYERVKHESA